METLFFIARHLCKVRSGLLCISKLCIYALLSYLSSRMEFSSNPAEWSLLLSCISILMHFVMTSAGGILSWSQMCFYRSLLTFVWPHRINNAEITSIHVIVLICLSHHDFSTDPLIRSVQATFPNHDAKIKVQIHSFFFFATQSLLQCTIFSSKHVPMCLFDVYILLHYYLFTNSGYALPMYMLDAFSWANWLWNLIALSITLHFHGIAFVYILELSTC